MKSKPTSRLLRQNRYSISLILSKSVCKKLGLSAGDYVTIKSIKDKIIIQKSKEEIAKLD
jgi:hypothetical protein